jgi:L-arabinose transport system ATP-binding protein
MGPRFREGTTFVMTGTPLCRVTDIVKTFGVVRALRGVSLDIRAGEILALIGENGAGKSTLMRILEGEHLPDGGTVAIDGRPVVLASTRDAHAAGIRVIHQEPEIIPELTVAENIFIGDLQPQGGLFLDRGALEARAAAMLADFDLSSALAPGRPCRDLGPAQRQVIEILRALRPGARLLAFDEPTSSLTEEEAGHLFTIIRRLKAQGTAVVYISHRLREIAGLADRVAVLRDGQLVADIPAASASQDDLVRLMVGRPITDLFDRSARRHGPVRLEVRGLTTHKVRDITFQLRAGEVLGLGGLVGAGRSELARGLVGFDRATAGTIAIDGAPVRIRAPGDAIMAGIGFVPEDRKQEALLLLRSVRDNISLGVPDKVSRFGFFDRRAERTLAERMATALRIKTPSIEQPVGKLSGGNQQKVVFARWMAREPRILILDEPTRGVDVGAKAEIYRLVETLAASGIAIILISSEMPELLGLADRILVMDGGRIVGALEGEAATEQAVLDLAMQSHVARVAPERKVAG